MHMEGVFLWRLFFFYVNFSRGFLPVWALDPVECGMKLREVIPLFFRPFPAKRFFLLFSLSFFQFTPFPLLDDLGRRIAGGRGSSHYSVLFSPFTGIFPPPELFPPTFPGSLCAQCAGQCCRTGDGARENFLVSRCSLSPLSLV